MKNKKFKKILDLNDKIPTAAQTRKFLKDEWHSWTDLEKIIAAVILLQNDVSICISGDESLRKKYGDDFESKRKSSHKRLAVLDDLLESITNDIQNYDDYVNGLKKSPPGEIPRQYGWSLKRHNDYVQLMSFIHQIDSKREWEFKNITEMIISAKEMLGLDE